MTQKQAARCRKKATSSSLCIHNDCKFGVQAPPVGSTADSHTPQRPNAKARIAQASSSTRSSFPQMHFLVFFVPPAFVQTTSGDPFFYSFIQPQTILSFRRPQTTLSFVQTTSDDSFVQTTSDDPLSFVFRRPQTTAFLSFSDDL